MSKAASAFHASTRDSFTAPRHNIVSIVSAMTEPRAELFPVHGLFENSMQGYRSELSTCHTTDKAPFTALTIYINKAIQLFLSKQEQGFLFISIPLPLLAHQPFNDQLISMMQYMPYLYGRLILLLQEDDLYPDTDNERTLMLANTSLSAAGIQLGIEIKHSSCLNSNHLRCLPSPYVLINYSDDWQQPQSTIDELNTIIRHCRSKSWPLLVDYRHHDDDRKPS